ncbi:serine hydrolase domain-containing protein [Microbulbifer hainanensis]|uniref:serine hydrolase domain-containing protein n=1 Tax=Microbulbifer hainanensis TaxID=2735675 RepID=UPI001868E7CE|nr:serine hydrolase domain-containing protein [Microbulbifer hainanensis]
MVNAVFRLLATVALTVGAVAVAHANELRWNDSTSAAIDKNIAQLMEQTQTPGVAVAVIHNGKLLKESYYGLASVEYGVPVSEDTVFWLASVSKQFTAALILVLEQQGKLALDDSIRKYLPELPESWGAIKVRHLLTQTSGLNGYEDDRDACVICNPDLGKPLQISDYLMQAAKLKPDFAPGDEFHYGDTNPELLAIIASRASGKPFPQLMHDALFQPAGMSGAYIYDYARVMPNQITGYAVSHGILRRDFNRDSFLQLDHKNFGGAGNIFATLTDVIHWNAALNSDRLLSSKNREQMWTAVRLNSGETAPYGFNFEIHNYPGGKVIGHNGIAGTEIWKLPEQKLDIIVLSNRGMSYSWAYVTTIADTLGLLDGLTPERMAEELGAALSPDRNIPMDGHYIWRWADMLDMDLRLWEDDGSLKGSFAGVPVEPYALDDGRIMLYSKMFWFPRRNSFPSTLEIKPDGVTLGWSEGDSVPMHRVATAD